MPREELLRRISSQELTGWMAYYRFKPFGEERADLRSGVAASAIVNTLRAAHFKDPEMTTPHDFMPFTETPELTDDERAERLAAKLAVLGAPTG